MYNPSGDSSHEGNSSVPSSAAAAHYAYPSAGAAAEPLGRVPTYNLPQRRTAGAIAGTAQPQQQQQQQHSYGYAYPSGSTNSPGPAQRSYAAPAAVFTPYGSYTGVVTAATEQQQQQHAVAEPKQYLYAHNVATAVVLLPLLVLTLSSHESSYPVILFLFLALVLYALDLANQRDAVFYMSWVAVPVMTCSSGWFWLLETDDEDQADEGGWEVLSIICQTGVTALMWIAAVSWLCLQLEWLVKPSAPTSLARQLEACLHATLPLVAASVGSHFAATQWITDWQGRDVAATAAPLLFAALLTAAMILVGSCTSSFAPSSSPLSSRTSDTNNDKTSSSSPSGTTSFCVSTSVAFGHATLLLVVPPLMHLATFWGRILSRYSSFDDWCDWFLSISIPYVLLAFLGLLHQAHVLPSPYGKLRIVTGGSSSRVGVGGSAFSVGSLVQILALLLTSIALQQRYLIPLTHSYSYRFMGVKPPAWILSAYWTAATVSSLAAGWLWGRKSNITGEPLMGEYHEDVVQLCLALTGMAMGKGFGMPWNFTPLPILAFLGLSLWLASRMLRYLCIFLFVIHAAAFVAFTYRFAGMDRKMHLVFPSTDLSLLYFGMVAIATSILAGLVAGLAVRATGGILSSFVRRIDLAGLLLILYSVILLDLEISLLEPRGENRQLAGVHVHGDSAESRVKMYSPGWGCLTSAALIGVTVFMKQVRIVKASSALTVISIAVGKCLTFYGHAIFMEIGVYTEGKAMFLHAIMTSAVIIVVAAPSVFLEPVYVKTSSRYKRSLAGRSELPNSVRRTIFIYNFIFLPIIALVAVECLHPVIDAFFLQFRDALNNTTAPRSIMLASAVCLWSVASLAMLNHYLPDGGGEFWKKLSALTFLAGIFLFLAAPMISQKPDFISSNPYVAASSVGAKLQIRSKQRNGGWGLLSACLASLLAMTGVLDLKERRNTSGEKDRFLLFRTMVFSLMFGGGVTWFTIVQTMSESEWSFLFLTMISSLTMAFLGTVAAVLGYFIELENFDEVEQLGKTWILIFPVFLVVSGIPQLFSSQTTHPFAASGWLSTYLLVSALTTFSLSTSLRSRRKKDTRTRALGNLFCVLSFGCFISILYGRFGVAGIVDYALTTVLGIPAPVVGTLVAALVLFGLEGDATSGTGRRAPAASGPRKSAPSPMDTWSLPLPQLKKSNRLFPLFFGISGVFLLASLFAILFRGTGLLLFFFGGPSAASRQDDLSGLFPGNISATAINPDLAALAENSEAIFAIARLGYSGLWTSPHIFGPVLHLAGVAAIVPSFLLSTQKWWWRQRRGGGGIQQFQQSIPVSLLLLTTCLNLFPLLLCRGIPCLTAAALLNLAVGGLHVVAQRRADQDSNMQL